MAPTTQMSVTSFRGLFTPLEQAQIELAAVHDPSVSAPAQLYAAGIRANQALLAGASLVDLAFQPTRDGVLGLEAGGTLAAGRALQILNHVVQDHERP